ncbi:GNAT family N-acetyltransferase [Natronomonas salina]|uniref:GNAT family N-acetyltransferase n=1 Tax=Natronomonas salina TaxID=1710540 RepID=UPI0015B4C8C8|nr:GNAT family N-acetyltransferase [Natronomonas salina]QLD89392.1 GNAT family N-acetyltransferase [Natronomonas salina]
MDVRPATSGDAARVREIAETSLRASYSLSPDRIESLVGTLFAAERLAQRADDPEALLFVVEDGGTVVGFADVELGPEAAIQWLHVDPEHRGLGAGTRLFERAQAAAADRDLPVVARVLSENEEGKGFPERFGLRRSGRAKLEVGSEDLFEEVYAEDGVLETVAGEPSVEVPETVDVAGESHHVDESDRSPGVDGPFFGVYPPDDDEHVGYFCGNCGSTDVGSDSLGRLECQDCGNKHLADRWDAAYL